MSAITKTSSYAVSPIIVHIGEESMNFYVKILYILMINSVGSRCR